MVFRLPVIMGVFVVGAALLLSACSSGSTHSSPPSSPKPTKSSAKLGGFAAGPDPCRLVTSHDIVVTLKEPMTAISKSRSTCTYQNKGATDTVAITTAKMTLHGAEQAVLSTGHTVKGRVQHLSGVGNTAIAYLSVTKGLSIATCLFAKNGTFVFLHIDRPHPAHLLQEAVALSRTAANRV